jgi:hypothetical protein
LSPAIDSLYPASVGLRAVVLDLDGILADARPKARLVRAGGHEGVDAWLPESVATWAAELGQPVIVDLSALSPVEQREYARSFAEAWAETDAPTEVLVHELGDTRPRGRGRGLMVGAACLAVVALPITTGLSLAALAGLGLGMALGFGRVPR